uniref:Peptidase C39-like domain-containing protein n=1 Tax=Candidatus Nitrotoga fabula TaxID=2182327 RepID=A0A2X0SIU8_9PROT|nr:protein of unknown function [Candidatus Nitrotoga fabula]
MTILNTILDVKPIAQTKTMSCWAAAAAMLVSWKKARIYTELELATMAGPPYIDAFNSNAGLSGSQFVDLATQLGMGVEAPQNFLPAGYESLLKKHGPLWIAAGLGEGGLRRHVRVLRGVSGDGTSNNTKAYILDPDGGRDYHSTMLQFAQELESIAKEEIAVGHDLYTQVIRYS